ncbi:FAD-dependent oxidoreductase, partial [Thermodesulfobacteriota bacterium]
QKWDEVADVVIVGTGFSGLAAAIVAKELGLSVILIEKTRVSGGNSIIAGGGANAVDPLRQGRQGITDSTDLHFEQTMAGGDNINEPEKVREMVDNALDGAVNYLERLGLIWPEKVIRGFGALYERTHYKGYYIDKKDKKWVEGAANIHAMLDKLEELNQKILYNHKLTRIIREKPLDGRVFGIEVDVVGDKKFFMAKRGVILASGGFAANLKWVTQLDRRLAHTNTSNHRGATGECIKLAQDIGADTLHMDYIQAIPMKVKAPFKGMFFQIESAEINKITASMPYRIFVNSKGNRFVNEGARRDIVRNAALTQPFFEPKKNIKADSIEELEDKLGLPQKSLVKTVEKYNIACEIKNDKEFGKDPALLVPIKTSPFKAISKAMMRHHTMGGLMVKGTTGQVIDRLGKVIQGLYAAGEVTGGTHGANRLGHNGTVDCLVFGQLCAKMIAKENP